MLIGLTGGIGSGKTTVANLFKDLGIDLIDADQIARELVTPNSNNLHKIIEYFGKDLLLADGNLNRTALRDIIFNDSTAKLWLEALLHPQIYTKILEFKTKINSAYGILDIPLLIETKAKDLVDRILVIDAAPEQQIARVKQRSNLTNSTINKIIDTQANRNSRNQSADEIITNNYGLSELKTQVLQLHQKYLNIANHGC